MSTNAAMSSTNMKLNYVYQVFLLVLYLPKLRVCYINPRHDEVEGDQMPTIHKQPTIHINRLLDNVQNIQGAHPVFYNVGH